MVSPIPSVSMPAINPAGLSNPSVAKRAADAAGTSQAEKGGFGSVVSSAIDEVSQRTQQAEHAAEAAAVGDLASVSDYMIAATEAQLATEITVAVRDRAVSAFNDIMRMQI